MKWIKTRRRLLALAMGMILIELFIFWAYQLNADALEYLLELQIFVLITAGAVDCTVFYQKYRELVKREIQPDLRSPSVKDDPVENQYEVLLERSEQRRLDEKNEYDLKYLQQENLYAMWVHQNKLPIAAMKLILEDEHADVMQMKSQLLRMEQYTHMILAVSRMNSPETDYQFMEVQADDLIRPAIRTFALEFILRKISIDYASSDSLFLTDPKWMVFVLEQILSNALKYANSKISIWVQQEKIYIQDDGLGISKADLARIFVRGQTGVHGRKDMESTGLGLYLCCEIMKQLNHSISAENGPNGGLRVCLDLHQCSLQTE